MFAIQCLDAFSYWLYLENKSAFKANGGVGSCFGQAQTIGRLRAWICGWPLGEQPQQISTNIRDG